MSFSIMSIAGKVNNLRLFFLFVDIVEVHHDEIWGKL